jgi:hypothetical protein
MKTNQGMGNPLVIATVANSKEGQQAIGQGVNTLKYGLMVVGVIAGSVFLNKQYKKLRADRYARENAGNPNLTAAAIIYESFTRIGFSESSVLSMLIPAVNISTDETALYEIATKVTNLKAVVQSYSILFDRNLFTDVRQGLDTDELKRFWEIISSPATNNTTTLYPVGSTLYCAVKEGIIVNQAAKINGVWKGNEHLYDELSFREKVGDVVAHGVFTAADGNQENYYIVEAYFMAFPPQKTGVVLQHQITNKEV